MKIFQTVCGTIGVMGGLLSQHWDAAIWALAFLINVWSHK